MSLYEKIKTFSKSFLWVYLVTILSLPPLVLIGFVVLEKLPKSTNHKLISVKNLENSKLLEERLECWRIFNKMKENKDGAYSEFSHLLENTGIEKGTENKNTLDLDFEKLSKQFKDYPYYKGFFKDCDLIKSESIKRRLMGRYKE